MRGPFTPQPGQSVEDQIAELGALVNRLREELLRQDREHREAIDTLRQQTDEKLRAEQQRADEALNVVRADLDRLQETTTGGLRLQIEGVLGVVVGVFLTTWPDAVARWLPSWPPFRVAVFLVFFYAFLRVSLAWVKHYDARAAGQAIAAAPTPASPVSRPRRGKDATEGPALLPSFVSGVFPPGQEQTSDTTGTPTARAATSPKTTTWPCSPRGARG